jgi:hypothetical protein
MRPKWRWLDREMAGCRFHIARIHRIVSDPPAVRRKPSAIFIPHFELRLRRVYSGQQPIWRTNSGSSRIISIDNVCTRACEDECQIRRKRPRY